MTRQEFEALVANATKSTKYPISTYKSKNPKYVYVQMQRDGYLTSAYARVPFGVASAWLEPFHEIKDYVYWRLRPAAELPHGTFAEPPVAAAELFARFKSSIEELRYKTGVSPETSYDQELRDWLDGKDEPLDWQGSHGITPDEYFFITTLYGNMNEEGQRTMIRSFFRPLFVRAAERNVRNFRPNVEGYEGLRSPWMKARLCRMGEVLRQRGISMDEYVEELRSLERNATALNPTPALNRVIQDHRATAWKTLSVFVRDCVRGNCFPIDQRVERQLKKYQLLLDEMVLVRMCLELGENPRQVARLFYAAEL